MDKPFQIVIVGSGPGGLSAAARAAERGVSHILLEASPHISNTIYRYQKGKRVMAEPAALPLRSSLSFDAGIRENVLTKWRDELSQHNVNFRVNTPVISITGQFGSFQITLDSDEVLSAEVVVLAIGVQGNPRKLAVPGEDLPMVQYQLDDPDAYNNETIVVIGGGDAAVENALALAKRNRVILVNRQEEFSNCKEANLSLLLAAINTGSIETRISSRTERIERATNGTLNGTFPVIYSVQTPQGMEYISCHRIIARLGANPPRHLIESFGIHFQSKDSSSVPQLTAHYESNVNGLYIIGSLAGYPLIKQAMNQGYEVIEYILGIPIEPADEPLLKAKFSCVQKICTVNDGISLIRNNLPIFSSLTTLQLREFMLESSLLAPPEGEVIFKLNDYSNSFYSVLQGQVKIQLVSKEGEPIDITLDEGDFFGEMGLLSGRRRSGTAVAGKNCVLVETPRRSMLKLLSSARGVRQKLDEVSLKRAVRSYLDASITESELDHLVHDAKFKRYATGETIFNEGDNADGLYMIQRGSVVVSRLVDKKEVVLAYVSAGNYIGEMALVSNMPRSATVRAAALTEVVLLEAARVHALMEKNLSIRNKVDSQYMERVRSDENKITSQSSGLKKFLLDNGVGEATDILLIDYSRCICCNFCETACADTHDGSSRLDREAGPTYELIHLPTSCRHCEHPHCMKDCPPDAIHRSVNGEVYIQDNCIGCGNCQENCPYGVIQMASKKTYAPANFWDVIFGKTQPAQNNETELTQKKAVKCDMCKDIIAGAACVRACPTGAALRISPEKILGYI